MPFLYIYSMAIFFASFYVLLKNNKLLFLIIKFRIVFQIAILFGLVSQTFSIGLTT